MECVNHHHRRCDIEQQLRQLLLGMDIQYFNFRQHHAEQQKQKQLAHLRKNHTNMHRTSFPQKKCG